MGTTSPDGVGYPDVGYTSGIRLAVKNTADTTQTALAARAGRTFRPADSAALTALSSSYTLQADDKAYQVDTGVTYRYNGSAWKAWLPGSFSAIPTTVSAGSGSAALSSVGLVTATTVGTNLSVNGCFTSEYTGYEIIYDLTSSGAATLALKMRLSGTDASTAYDIQYNATVNATNFPAQSLNQTSLVFEAQAVTGKHNGTIRIYNPAVAVATTGTITNGSSANPMTSTTGLIQSSFFSHRTGTAYDGFSFIPSTGTVTGTVTIRGVY